MKSIPLLVCAAMVLGAMPPAHGGETHNLNAEWRFSWAKETIPLKQALASMEKNGVAVSQLAYDDSGWEVVSLPHPVNAHDSFDDHAVDAGEAAFRRGVMIYRKRFDWGTGNGERGTGKAFLTFETVRQTVYLWVNGHFAGYYEAGIAPCAFDVTEFLKKGENIVCVATDNCAARGTKIFTHETIPGHDPGDMSGAVYQWNTTDFNEVQGGLVGNVSLITKRSKTHLTLPYYNNLKTIGTYVTAKDFDFEKGAATICVKAEVRNESGAQVKAKLVVKAREAGTTGTIGTDGTAGTKSPVAAVPPSPSKIFLTAVESDVYEASPAPTRVASPDTTILSTEIRASGLVFWSPDTPHLYDVVVSLVDEKGDVLDSETIRTGFREVKYDAKSGGLKINGKNTWLTGYAQRATDEWAAIGVAPDWLQDYDAALIRKSNANFVRWMHVAPKPAPVRAFDKFGIVNVCPAGDKEGDVSGRAWAQRVEAMRDTMIYFRNSPSVVFWEAGNNQISPAHMKEMVELKKRIDPDGWRFMGCRTLQTKEQIAEAEYVGTMLHRHEMPAYESMKALGKFMPMMETEYARQESPRRSWDDFTPPDYDYRGRYLNGGKKETGYDVYDQTQEDFALSTAKEYAEFYGARASGRGAKTYSAVAALCWTDSNQHGRQSFSENCRTSGRVDAVRIPKVSFDVFRVMQSEDPAVMLVGHWNYPKLTKDSYMYPVKKYNGHFMEETGEMAQRDPLHKTVYAIGSVHCASVELIVNGKSKGVAEKPDHVFAYAFPNIDVTESGTAEVVARDKAGKEIARHTVRSFVGNGTVKAEVTTGPKGWLADGSDIAVVDFKLVDGNGTIHPYASDKIKFRLEGGAKFMGGWNSGVFGDASPVGKDFVNLECGQARVFVKAGSTPGKVTLAWRCANGQGGQIPLEMKPVEVKGGLSAAPQQAFPANERTFARKTSAEAVQDLASSGSAKAVPYTVRVNGVAVRFATGMGEPMKPDDSTGVCCAYEPVLAALKAAGVKMEYVVEPKRIPANKKWLRKLSPTPFVPMVTVKAGGHEIDACAGFTELFIDNGKDRNLTNCEIYGVGKKNAKIVCGELAALIGYIPGVKIEIDNRAKTIDLKTEKSNRRSEVGGIKTSGVGVCRAVGEPVGFSWPEATREMKPWVYNWWMGSAVDEAGLECQCRELSAKGFGGFHVIPIYGANGPDNIYRGKWTDLLSQTWIGRWNLACRIAERHGLGIDLTMGSGWCFGGPWIDKGHAASSGMKVKRAGPGGQGYMIDPFDPEAMKRHIAVFAKHFGRDGDAMRPRAFYHDSYEYYGAEPKGGEDVDAAQIACFKVWTDWCRENGYLTRNEAHGSPCNWLDFYALADIPETEMFGKECRDILISKFASSAAHVKGTALVSAEACTWIDDHFRERPAEIKGFIDRLFLSGVNHVFYHGCCYSPVEAAWPGWCFYASLEMNPRNPIWREMGALNAYVTRCQSIFQTWTPDNDVAVVWDPASFRAKHHGKISAMSVHNTGWFYGEPIGKVAKRLYAEGYAFDYVSPRMVKAGLARKYAVLVDPPECLGADPQRRARLLEGAKRMKFDATSGLLATRWRKGGETGYFVVNTGAVVRVVTAGEEFTAADPLSGAIAKTRAAKLEPMHSLFVVGEGFRVEGGMEVPVKPQKGGIGDSAIPVKGPWRVSALCGGPELPPPCTLESLVGWETFSEFFSGTMLYRTTFDVGKMRPRRLSLGHVREIARVRLNGRDLGVRFMPPYDYAVPADILKKTGNELEVEVTNLGANRLRWNDVNKVDWKYFSDINIVDANYKKFDAARWKPLPSGLLGPVRIEGR